MHVEQVKEELEERDEGARDRGVCQVKCFASAGERRAVTAGFAQMALQAW